AQRAGWSLCQTPAVNRSKHGDVVAAALPNIPQAIVGLLGTAAVGAIWSVVNVDFGVPGIVTRFQQLEPKVLVTIDGLELNGKIRDQVSELDGLLGELDTVTNHVLVENTWTASTADIEPLVSKHNVSSELWSNIVADGC